MPTAIYSIYRAYTANVL